MVRQKIKEMDHALTCNNEQTNKLGLRRAVDQKLSMVKEVHQGLGRTIPVDTIVGDIRQQFNDGDLQTKKEDVMERITKVTKDTAMPITLNPTMILHN